MVRGCLESKIEAGEPGTFQSMENGLPCPRPPPHHHHLGPSVIDGAHTERLHPLTQPLWSSTDHALRGHPSSTELQLLFHQPRSTFKYALCGPSLMS